MVCGSFYDWAKGRGIVSCEREEPEDGCKASAFFSWWKSRSAEANRMHDWDFAVVWSSTCTQWKTYEAQAASSWYFAIWICSGLLSIWHKYFKLPKNYSFWCILFQCIVLIRIDEATSFSICLEGCFSFLFCYGDGGNELKFVFFLLSLLFLNCYLHCFMNIFVIFVALWSKILQKVSHFFTIVTIFCVCDHKSSLVLEKKKTHHALHYYVSNDDPLSLYIELRIDYFYLNHSKGVL